jgi:hypothetical protein
LAVSLLQLFHETFRAIFAVFVSFSGEKYQWNFHGGTQAWGALLKSTLRIKPSTAIRPGEQKNHASFSEDELKTLCLI